MLNKLQKKWKVSKVRLLLILITFATGGSACGWLGKLILSNLHIEKGVLWFILYIVLVTLLWPICVLAISVITGQFSFFKKYLTKMFNRMAGKRVKNEKNKITRVAIFASGAGSNAEKIIQHFQEHPTIYISLIVSNKKGAGVLTIASQNQIPSLLINRSDFYNNDTDIELFKKTGIDFIVLAGFLWKMPENFIKAFPNKIINIHPALLPKYGGKGMYGHFVHEAVISNKEKESGISIHFVDEIYDHGNIILQETCTISKEDDANSLAKKVQVLEHTHFAKCIEAVIEKNS